MASTVVTELNALIQDSLQTVTYKFVSKRFNIPYDVSKQILYEYKMNNGENVLVTYLLSGYDAEKRHVVKVVEESKVEEEKGHMSKIEALHVYSVQAKGMKSTENMHEVDLGQSREELGSSLGPKFAALGRVVRQQEPERKQLDVAPIRRAKAEETMKPRQNEVKKRTFTIDSDDEDHGGGRTAEPEKKFKTYINDNGEEVTEVEERPKPADIKPKEQPAKMTSVAPKKVSKQKGIASFFSKKQ